MTAKKIFTITFSLLCFHAYSQSPDTTKYWKRGGVGTLSFSQVQLTNWVGGGQSNVSGMALLNMFSNYKRNHSTWDNSIDIAYGMVNLDKRSFIKTDDKIDLLSKYGHVAFGKWFYSALLNFRSQMSPGYNYPNDSVKISEFLAPAYLLLSLGMDYKPNDNFSVYVSPLTGRLTFVKDQQLADAGAFGVEPAQYDPETGALVKRGETVREEFGAYMNINYRQKLGENVSLQTKLSLFSNYLEEAQNVDVAWDVLIGMKINRFLSANLSTTLLYDDDVDIAVYNNDNVQTGFGPRVQFKEVFALGLSFKF